MGWCTAQSLYLIMRNRLQLVLGNRNPTSNALSLCQSIRSILSVQKSGFFNILVYPQQSNLASQVRLYIYRFCSVPLDGAHPMGPYQSHRALTAVGLRFPEGATADVSPRIETALIYPSHHSNVLQTSGIQSGPYQKWILT